MSDFCNKQKSSYLYIYPITEFPKQGFFFSGFSNFIFHRWYLALFQRFHSVFFWIAAFEIRRQILWSLTFVGLANISFMKNSSIISNHIH